MRQSVSPQILVVDTGSRTLDSIAVLEELSAIETVEVSRLNIGQTAHPSDNISIAMDFAFSRCETMFLLATHVDVFPKRRGLISHLLSIVSADQPVVGWEMSPRGPGSEGDHKGTVSNGFPGHCCTLFHMPTMDLIGAGWSIRRSANQFGTSRGRDPQIKGWPDTETCLGKLFQREKIRPIFLGRETNNENQETEFWTHARSRTNEGETPRHHKAFTEASERLRLWSRASLQQLPTAEKSHVAWPEKMELCPYRYPLGEHHGCGLLRSYFRSVDPTSFQVDEITCRHCCHFPERPTETKFNAALWQALSRISRRIVGSRTATPSLLRLAKKTLKQTATKLLEARVHTDANSFFPQS